MNSSDDLKVWDPSKGPLTRHVRTFARWLLEGGTLRCQPPEGACWGCLGLCFGSVWGCVLGVFWECLGCVWGVFETFLFLQKKHKTKKT